MKKILSPKKMPFKENSFQPEFSSQLCLRIQGVCPERNWRTKDGQTDGQTEILVSNIGSIMNGAD